MSSVCVQLSDGLLSSGEAASGLLSRGATASQFQFANCSRSLIFIDLPTDVAGNLVGQHERVRQMRLRELAREKGAELAGARVVPGLSTTTGAIAGVIITY